MPVQRWLSPGPGHCLIMGLLDMKSLLGAATVMDALMYGGMCGLDVLTSIYMITSFAALLFFELCCARHYNSGSH